MSQQPDGMQPAGFFSVGHLVILLCILSILQRCKLGVPGTGQVSVALRPSCPSRAQWNRMKGSSEC